MSGWKVWHNCAGAMKAGGESLRLAARQVDFDVAAEKSRFFELRAAPARVPRRGGS